MDEKITYEDAKISLEKIITTLNKDDLIDWSNHLIKKALQIRKAESAELEDQDDEALTGPEEKPEKPVTSIAERKKQRVLEKIRTTLRGSLPQFALAPNEADLMPTSLAFEGYTTQNTIHVDSFLFPDDEIIDEYCEKGLLARDFCTKCGGRDIQPLNYISHSISDVQARFIFDHILPSDLSHATILDVGSRLGVLLYYGFLYSNAPSLIGVEFNPFFVEQSNKVISKCKMGTRVKVIGDDIKNQKELVASADVVFLNNVFDAFVDKPQQIELWKFLLSSITKKGTLIITIPSIETSLEMNEVTTSDLDPFKYLEKKEVAVPFAASMDEEYLEEIKELFVYIVK